MSAPVSVTTEHEERAHAQMRCTRPDMPPLDVLRSYWALYSCLRNRALGIARGQTLPPEPVATAPPPPPKAASPQRRRNDGTPAPFDPRAAASGEYVHHFGDEAP